MTTNAVRLKKLVIVGLGLIGGSLAKALKANAVKPSPQFLVDTIVGCGRSEATLQEALKQGLIDSYSLDLSDACKDADMVLLAAPIGATQVLLQSIKASGNANLVITDAGSVKGNVIAAAKAVYSEVPVKLVPGHPVAGSEKSGVHAADASLYKSHKVILTPHKTTSAEAVSLVSALWQSVGAQVLAMDVKHHDQVLAATSHLPHLLAFSLVDTLAGDPDNREIFEYAAGGFRDFTRIAASDPTMWLDIFLANSEASLAALDGFTAGLAKFRQALVAQDANAMLGVMTRAKSAREHFSAVLESRADIDVGEPHSSGSQQSSHENSHKS